MPVGNYNQALMWLTARTRFDWTAVSVEPHSVFGRVDSLEAQSGLLKVKVEKVGTPKDWKITFFYEDAHFVSHKDWLLENAWPHSVKKARDRLSTFRSHLHNNTSGDQRPDVLDTLTK